MNEQEMKALKEEVNDLNFKCLTKRMEYQSEIIKKLDHLVDHFLSSLKKRSPKAMENKDLDWPKEFRLLKDGENLHVYHDGSNERMWYEIHIESDNGFTYSLLSQILFTESDLVALTDTELEARIDQFIENCFRKHKVEDLHQCSACGHVEHFHSMGD